MVEVRHPGQRNFYQVDRYLNGEHQYLNGYDELRHFLLNYPRDISEFKSSWQGNTWEKFGARFGVTKDNVVVAKELIIKTYTIRGTSYEWIEPLNGYVELMCIATRK